MSTVQEDDVAVAEAGKNDANILVKIGEEPNLKVRLKKVVRYAKILKAEIEAIQKVQVQLQEKKKELLNGHITDDEESEVQVVAAKKPAGAKKPVAKTPGKRGPGGKYTQPEVVAIILGKSKEPLALKDIVTKLPSIDGFVSGSADPSASIAVCVSGMKKKDLLNQDDSRRYLLTKAGKQFLTGIVKTKGVKGLSVA